MMTLAMLQDGMLHNGLIMNTCFRLRLLLRHHRHIHHQREIPKRGACQVGQEHRTHINDSLLWMFNIAATSILSQRNHNRTMSGHHTNVGPVNFQLSVFMFDVYK